MNSEKNRSEIIKLSKKHQIISPFTSMLILDRVEDYVAHSIEPPKELKQKYDELTARKINNKKDRIARLQNQLFNEYENFSFVLNTIAPHKNAGNCWSILVVINLFSSPRISPEQPPDFLETSFPLFIIS